MQNKMISGEFIDSHVHISVVFVKEFGKWFKCNGQHTCKASIGLNGTCPKYYVWWEEYCVDTLSDARKLYAQFDNQFSARTNGDILNVYMDSTEKLKGKISTILNLIATAFTWHVKPAGGRKGYGDGMPTGEDRAEALVSTENQDSLAFLYDILTPSGS